MNILQKIIKDKLVEVEKAKNSVSENTLRESPYFERSCYSFADSIREKSGVISEFKRKSPSKGLINGEALIQEVVKGYEEAGASAVSVLTDTKYFGGTRNDLITARELIKIPILRKDFIVNGYQLTESKAMGADVILLIASALEIHQCNDLAEYAKELGLNVFLEIHNDHELSYISKNIDVVGINNRNLKTFEVNIENSIRLSKSLPKDMVKVAESGISDVATVIKMKEEGFEGFLVGENFMKTDNPGLACKEFISESKL